MAKNNPLTPGWRIRAGAVLLLGGGMLVLTGFGSGCGGPRVGLSDRRPANAELLIVSRASVEGALKPSG